MVSPLTEIGGADEADLGVSQLGFEHVKSDGLRVSISLYIQVWRLPESSELG